MSGTRRVVRVKRVHKKKHVTWANSGVSDTPTPMERHRLETVREIPLIGRPGSTAQARLALEARRRASRRASVK